MESNGCNEDIYDYGQDDNGNEDQMYIISNECNVNGSNFEVGASNNILQMQDENAQLIGDQYIYYDDSGQAFIIDETNDENPVGDFEINFPDCNVTYRCPICPKIYQNANAFTKHMRENHFVKVFTCRQCEQFFDNLSLLFLHARRTHVDPKKPSKNPSSFKFHCPDCNYMTNNGGTMEHHLRAHSGVKPYKCEICDKSFAQKANMKTHRNRHIHKDRIFRCDICSKSFSSYDIYLAHLRTREHELQEHFQTIITSKVQIQCLGCNLEFTSYYDINKHSRSCDILKDLPNKFWCVQCKMDFDSSMSLKHHLKSHGNNQIIACPVCGERGFPGFNQLNHHITRAHALKVNRRNVCRYCEMTFETKEMLTNHIEEMHVSEKNARQSRGAAGRYRCQYSDCDFTSNSVMQMDRHHDQHLSNTLPSSVPKRKTAIRRPRKPIENVFFTKEELLEPEIEHLHTMVDDNEVLRGYDSDVKLEMIEPEQDYIDDMDVDDLERLAASFVDQSTAMPFGTCEIKRKRGRPRKTAEKSINYLPVIKNEHFDMQINNQSH